LKEYHTKASFFFTGRFYRNSAFKPIIQQLKKQGHYLGAHSDAHLLYCDWSKRDSLFVSRNEFRTDLSNNYAVMQSFGITKKDAHYFLPPYEWYNDTIATWTKEMGLQLINYTPGTVSHADYTTPEATNYRSSTTIWNSIQSFEITHNTSLNGFILLLHIGTDPKRIDKFYYQLPLLLQWLKDKGYKLVRIDELLGESVN
jgi:peptidoglycan/xylan/chitin deacetylase (PgdA/CDA1 family)